uniref:Uncharacterized protein n=1 Tax=Moniliophthora roreri TaxID=221103 RepID=A0A0W0G556_MONRR
MLAVFNVEYIAVF